MSPEPQPIDLDAPPTEEVVEFGSPSAPRRRRPAAGFGHSLLTDSRTVPLAAALAVVAVFASLVSEWQVTTVDRAVFGGELGDRLIPTDATDLGALGTGYLIGLFVLAGALVLTMFGPPAGRHHARLVGLSAGGTLIGVLLALATSLGNQSRIISRLYTLELNNNQMSLAYGRGLWCAFAGVVFALVALYLAGRHLAQAAPGTADEAEPAAVWSWRRPAARAEEDPADEPMELTVGPARPFTSTADDRDKESPSGRAGISE